jgi:hypothetical protein
MTQSPSEINNEIQSCKTIAQINKLYARYFKELMTLQESMGKRMIETGRTEPLDIVRVATIQLIYDIIKKKEEMIMLELAKNN